MLPPTAQLPRNEAEAGNSHEDAGSALLAQEAKGKKPKGLPQAGGRTLLCLKGIRHARARFKQHCKPW